MTKFVEVELDEADALAELDGPLELKLFSVLDGFGKLIRLFGKLGELGINKLLLVEVELALRLEVDGVRIWASCGKLKFPRPKLLLLLLLVSGWLKLELTRDPFEEEGFGNSDA